MPTGSKYPALDIPNVDIWDFVFSRTDREYPEDKVLFSDPDTGLAHTYRDLRDLSIRFGAGLKSQPGWHTGDVVAVFSPNHVDWPVVLWGTYWAGGVCSLINTSYTAGEVEFQITDSNAKYLVTHPGLLSVVTEVVRKGAISVSHILLLGDENASQQTRFRYFLSLPSPRPVVRPKIDPQSSVAFLVYSSGTTGKPKGVMLTHKNIVSNIMMITETYNGNISWKGQSGRGDSMIGFLPFFHSYGLTAVIHVPTYLGVEIAVMPKFDLERFCAITETRRISYASVVPPVISALAKSPIVDKYDLSSVRRMMSGAAPLKKDIMELVYKRLKIPLLQGYGLSETSPVTHQQAWDDWGKYYGSIGPLIANQESKVISSTGEEVTNGEVGELCVKGPNIFKGYLNNQAATENTFTPDGVLKTGDIGYQDRQGNVYITDRIKEMIKYKGFPIAPAELEGVLVSHSKIVDAGVVGVYDEQQTTELPRAYVVVYPGVPQDDTTAYEISKWMEKRVAHHKFLRGGVKFVDEIPKNPAGKILRTALRARAKAEGVARPKSKI